MQSPFELADDLVAAGKLGPEIAHTLLAEGVDPESAGQALRELGFDVKKSGGLRVSNYQKGSPGYLPLGTGELRLAGVN